MVIDLFLFKMLLASMVSDLFDIVVDVIDGFGDAMVSVFQKLVSIFYDAAGTPPGFTTIGILLLIGFGITLVFFVLRYIANLIKMRNR